MIYKRTSNERIKSRLSSYDDWRETCNIDDATVHERRVWRDHQYWSLRSRSLFPLDDDPHAAGLISNSPEGTQPWYYFSVEIEKNLAEYSFALFHFRVFIFSALLATTLYYSSSTTEAQTIGIEWRLNDGLHHSIHHLLIPYIIIF